MKKLFTLLFASAALFIATPAFAEPSHGKDAPAHTAPAHDGTDAHADAEKHGGAHHVLYSADDDGDGTPNWMDTETNGSGLTETPIFKVAMHTINFLIFLTVLYVFGRRPINDALANRAFGIRQELTDSATLRDEARARNEALGARLDKIEAEIEAMHDQAEQDAIRAEEKLVARAHSEASRIADAAQRSIRDEVQRARFALKRDAVALAVDLAEKHLKEQMGAEHHQKLAREFLTSLKEDNHV